MYFDTETLTRLLSDAEVQQKAAPAVAAARRRFTSPLAVAGTVLALKDRGLSPAELEGHVTNYLDLAGIELRDMPPAHRLIEAATQAVNTGSSGGLEAVWHGACAAYYEAEAFSLDNLPEPGQPEPEAPAEE